MKLQVRGARILDFDCESRPLSYLGGDYTTAEITSIAASFGLKEPMHCWLLGIHDPEVILDSFRELYDQADIVTGHYIRKFDLRLINGAMLEYGRPPLSPKLVSDTKIDLVKTRDISASQESLGEILGVSTPKYHMSQHAWRQANRLQNLTLTKTRVTDDVKMHMEMRLRLLEVGALGAPRMWYPS